MLRTAHAAPALLEPARASVSLPTLIGREQARQRRNRRWRFALLLLIPVLAVSLWLALRPRPIPLGARFRLEPPSRGDLLREVRATGRVEAVSTVQVGAELSGRIATVEATYNDAVKAGQVLARFDRASLDAQRAQIEAGVAQARAAVAQAAADLAQARRTLGRSEALHQRGAQSAAEHDVVENGATVAEARLRAAQAQLSAQEAALALARTNLTHAVIRAPIDGVIITRNIDPGQTVASMLTTPVLFTVAADLKKMRVIANVDEADIGEVAVGQRASFGVNAWPTRVFEGVVTEVRNAPIVVQDVVTYGVVIEVPNDDLALRPGMTATAHVRTATARDVWRVPNAALHLTPPGSLRGDKPAVFALQGDRLARVDLELGITDGESTEVKGPIDPKLRIAVELTAAGKKAYGIVR